jgi:hypothetical protein
LRLPQEHILELAEIGGGGALNWQQQMLVDEGCYEDGEDGDWEESEDWGTEYSWDGSEESSCAPCGDE